MQNLNTAQLKYLQQLRAARQKQQSVLEAGGLLSTQIGDVDARGGLMEQAGPIQPAERGQPAAALEMINPRLLGNDTGLMAGAAPEQRQVLKYRKGLLESGNPMLIAQAMGGQADYMKNINQSVVQPQAQPQAPRTKIALNPQGQRVFATNEQIAGGGFSPDVRGAGQNININTGSKIGEEDKAFAKAQGSSQAKYFSKIESDGDEARSMLPNIAEMRNLTAAMPKSGFFGESLGAYSRLLEGLGASNELITAMGGMNPGNVDQLNARAMDFVMKRIESTKGAVSDKEMAAFAKSVAGIKNTPAGNAAILDFAEKVSLRAIERQSFFADFSGGLATKSNRNEAKRQWRKYVRDNPVIQPAAQGQPAEQGQPAAQGQPAEQRVDLSDDDLLKELAAL